MMLMPDILTIFALEINSMRRQRLIAKLVQYLNLQAEADDFDIIHENIQKDIIFKGTNLWILIFAILVASVGLNMNSTAVIIGAMLISPLMGPINGMGYSVATYNYAMFRKAFKNFSFAVIASLVASTAYFAISPISTAHSELLARTSPSIYDVLIAFFGGMAGIIAATSKQKGNVIPGVAIATALMPPLCTAGYGLATAQFNYFFGAIYLFTINTVFIGISAVVISQLLKFPIRTLVDSHQRNVVNRWISVVIIIVLLPSIYFGWGLVKKEKFIENASRYVKNVSIIEGNFLLKNEINPDTKTIQLVYGGSTITDKQKKSIKDRANDFDLNGVNIEFLQGLSFDEIMQKEEDETNKLKAEVSQLYTMLQQKEAVVDSITQKKYFGQSMLREIKTIYPEVVGCSVSETFMFHDSTENAKKIKLVIVETSKKKLSSDDQKKIEAWLKVRLSTNRIRVYFED
jgi:uncharacterized hydrophobic protein (TIGR00271 family)